MSSRVVTAVLCAVVLCGDLFLRHMGAAPKWSSTILSDAMLVLYSVTELFAQWMRKLELE